MTSEVLSENPLIQKFLSDPFAFIEPEQRPISPISFPGSQNITTETPDKDTYERIIKLRKVEWVIDSKWRLLDDQGIGDKLALVGPPSIGKTTLGVSLKILTPQVVDLNSLDVFSFGSENAVKGVHGWQKGGRKRKDIPILEGDDIQTAIILLRRIRDFRDTDFPVSLADMPGGKRTDKEWFFPFLVKPIDGLILLGRNREELDIWSTSLGEISKPICAKVLVGSQDNRSESNDCVLVKELSGKPAVYDPGVIQLGEILMKRAAEKLVENNILK